MKKKKKQNIILAGIAIAIIGSYVGYSFYIEQVRQKGFAFGNEIQQIQEEVKRLQVDFNSKVTQWKEGSITKEEMLEFSKKHIEDMGDIISKYDTLRPPEPFTVSVKLFKMSTQAQLESDLEFIEWIKTDDKSHMLKSDSLLQESFDYEMSALGEFNAVKMGLK